MKRKKIGENPIKMINNGRKICKNNYFTGKIGTIFF